ncbi:DnaJ super family protein [Cotonvirus japonicus]|uniref:DnaJ super family protein n=1 Tax=Cotonvirus japonicus TaxID=2811091 RepID=A0ABM7NTU8_9VIRU|nr:DnaJ super family protein [Cotonvirus japonicus]BCS83497.1 DnaJ super family protein [Cotonvirus japonicus]
MDESIKLYNEYINAKYNYINHLKNQLTHQFILETKDLVWDETHWAIGTFLKSKNPSDYKNSNSDNTELKTLYKKLSMICHPDKCSESWATKIFVLVNELYTNSNIAKLKELLNIYENQGSFAAYIDSEDILIDKETQIKCWESQLWYVWLSPVADTNLRNLLKDILITPEEYNKRLKIQNDKLEQEINDLRLNLNR